MHGMGCLQFPAGQAALVLALTLGILAVSAFGLGEAASAASAGSGSTGIRLETREGPLEVTPLGHSSLMFEFRGVVIHVDPYSRVADYSKLPKAGQVWITHDHPDHLDLAAIQAIVTPNTRFIADPRSAERLQAWRERVVVLKNGQQTTLDGVTVEAVPAYNLVRERQPNVKYHPKGWYNGYVASFGGERVYIAGDTECIPEMRELPPIALAFVPINLPFTMPPEEAVGCLKVMAPRIVVPYHQGDSDPEVVARALQGSGIEVRVLRLP